MAITRATPPERRDLPAPPLAGAARAALLGPHRAFALRAGDLAVRYRPEVGVFGAFLGEPSEEAWAALAALPGGRVGLLSDAPLPVPAGWGRLADLPIVQMTGADADGGDEDPEVVALTAADVPAMLDLAQRTRPGPFFAETIALGGYVGVWRDGTLAAMAGRRLQVPGWIEVSAVCADPAFRGAGLGRRVTAAVARGIRADGAEPFLHVLETNPARRLYATMGFADAGAVHVTAAQVAA